MILEEMVKDILREEYDRIKTIIPYDGMYDEMSKKIVNKIKKEIVNG
tara:strand:- start:297 stop:437 length:141 start_codon:yes stop_codon:yes gene_type:complete